MKCRAGVAFGSCLKCQLARQNRAAGGRSRPSFHAPGALALKFLQIYYVLDTELRLLWVGGEWDEFALENSAPGARANEVLSTSLLGHIADSTTKDAVKALIGAVQDMQTPLRIDYRCDSPTMLRRFQMTIQPMKDGRILMVHDLRDAHSFDSPRGPWHHKGDAAAEKCSFCCAVRVPGQTWTAPEALLVDHPAEVALTLCPDCVARVEEAIAALRGSRSPVPPVTGGFGPDRGAGPGRG